MLSTAVKLDVVKNGRISVHPVSETRVEMRVSGQLPIVWPERFAAAMAPQGIAVRRGQAERQGEQWAGHFELEVTRPDHDIGTIDFARVIEALPPPRQPRPIAVLHHGLVRLTDTVRLAIQAQDRHGLLADVLSTLKQMGLYARRITIESDSDLVTQCFWLTTFGGRQPDFQTERQLREFVVTCRRLRRS